MHQIWIWPFLVLAAAGFSASLISHVSALLGSPGPFGKDAMVLHAGIFVVWVPAVLVARRLSRDFKQKDFWRAALRGCPRWLRVAALASFVYALVNFALFLFLVVSRGEAQPPAALELRGFSGHWMAFYCVAAAILYSALRAPALDHARRCPRGHSVSPLAKYCEECGEPVPEARATSDR